MESLSLAECGLLMWNASNRQWQGEMTLPSGRAVAIIVSPEPQSPPPSEQWRTTVLKRLTWVRSYAPAILAAVADRTFDGWLAGWRDGEIDGITSKDEFTRGLTLDGITIYEPSTSLHLVVGAGDLFGGHAVALEIGEDGEILTEPSLFG